MPGERNEPSPAAMVCGSSSWLVQVTLSPRCTVRVGGTNAKLVMLTAVPATGADGVWAGAAAVAAGLIGAMPCIGAMPTEVPPLGPKFTVGGGDDGVADGAFEQPAAAAAAITAAAMAALVRDRRNITEPPLGKRCRAVTR